MKYIKRITVVALLSVTCFVALAGCSDLETKPKNEEAYLSYQKMKERNKETYPLLYFENIAKDTSKEPFYALGYKKDGKIIKRVSDRKYQEVVDPDLDTPYVVIDGGDYYIHRPPYYNFNQERVSGEVSEKE